MMQWNDPQRLNASPRELKALRMALSIWESLKGPWWVKLISLPLGLLFMAWVTPSSRTTGTLITAAIWNQDVVDNMVYLKNTIDQSLLWVDMLTKTSIVSSTTETTVATKSVAASGMGANGGFIYELYADVTNNTGGNQNAIFRFKFGATTIFADTHVVGTGASPTRFHWKFTVINNNSASAQIARAELDIVATTADSQTAISVASRQVMNNVATENTTGALNAVVTLQLGASDANLSAIVYAPIFRGPILNS
jgi:hypothetical protein